MQSKNRVFYGFYMGFLFLVTIGFIYILSPYFSALFWAVIFAVLFRPIYLKLLNKMPKKKNISALLTLILAILLGIIPISIIATSLTTQAVDLYEQIESGKLNIGEYLDLVYNNLPSPIHSFLERFHITSEFSFKEKLLQLFNQGSKFMATELVNISQNTFTFIMDLGIMLYLMYFFIRDGETIKEYIKRFIPLSGNHKIKLFSKFLTVVRATVKGNMLVAIAQGALGGIIFAILGIPSPILWGVIMAFLSLLPAIGAALVWLPVAIYLLVSGSTIEGIIMIVWGVVVIGMSDNLLRPILVGKDTRLPDYLILITTIGGMAVFGLNGFVIGPLLAALFITFWGELPNAVGLLEEDDVAAIESNHEEYIALSETHPEETVEALEKKMEK